VYYDLVHRNSKAHLTPVANIKSQMQQLTTIESGLPYQITLMGHGRMKGMISVWKLNDLCPTNPGSLIVHGPYASNDGGQTHDLQEQPFLL